MRPRVFASVCCVAFFLFGCATGNSRRGNSTYTAPSPDDYLPLLPHQSAADQWESQKRPLPPLPEDYGKGEVPGVSVSSASSEAGEPGGATEVPSTPLSLKQVSPSDLEALVDSYRGKVLLLNCWGIDCRPCVEEMPLLDKVLRELKSEGLAIAAVCTDTQSRTDDISRFIQQGNFTIDFYIRAPGPDTAFRRAVDPEYSADPFSILFDREGRAIATLGDALSEKDWRKLLTAAVKGERLPEIESEYVRYF